MQESKYEHLKCVEISEIIPIIREHEEQQWQIRCEAKPKLRTYITMKNSLETEKYVRYNLNRKERSYLAQLRLGILPLRIETGRYENLAIDKRTCQLCASGEVENEEHFLLKCEINQELRQQFYDKIKELVSANHFYDILESTFRDHPRQYSK